MTNLEELKNAAPCAMHDMQATVKRYHALACGELINFKNTGILPDGVIKTLATRIRPHFKEYSQEIVINYVKDYAVQLIASQDPTEGILPSTEAIITFAHRENPEGVRFEQYAKDPLPVWAVDVQPKNTYE